MARYSPTQKKNILQHSIRHRLVQLVEKNPGTTTRELGSMLDRSWSTTNYHLRQLEAHGFVIGIRSGRRVRFFHGKDPQEPKAIALLKQGRTMEFVQTIIETPDMIQKQVAEHLNMSRKVMGGYIQRLTHAGLIQEIRFDRRCRYQPTRVLHGVLESMRTTAATTKAIDTASA